VVTRSGVGDRNADRKALPHPSLSLASPPLASLCIPSLPPKSPTSEPEGLIKEAVKLRFLSLLVSLKLLQHRKAKKEAD